MDELLNIVELNKQQRDSRPRPKTLIYAGDVTGESRGEIQAKEFEKMCMKMSHIDDNFDEIMTTERMKTPSIHMDARPIVRFELGLGLMPVGFDEVSECMQRSYVPESLILANHSFPGFMDFLRYASPAGSLTNLQTSSPGLSDDSDVLEQEFVERQLQRKATHDRRRSGRLHHYNTLFGHDSANPLRARQRFHLRGFGCQLGRPLRIVVHSPARVKQPDASDLPASLSSLSLDQTNQ